MVSTKQSITFLCKYRLFISYYYNFIFLKCFILVKEALSDYYELRMYKVFLKYLSPFMHRL